MKSCKHKFRNPNPRNSREDEFSYVKGKRMETRLSDVLFTLHGMNAMIESEEQKMETIEIITQEVEQEIASESGLDQVDNLLKERRRRKELRELEERIGMTKDPNDKRKLQNQYSSKIRDEAHVEQITQKEFETAAILIEDLIPQIEDFMEKGIDYKSFLSEMKEKRHKKKESKKTDLTVEEKESAEISAVFKEVKVKKNREEKRRIVQKFLETKIEPGWGLVERHHLKKKKPKEGLVFNKALQKWVKKEDYDKALAQSEIDRIDERVRYTVRQ